MASENSYVQVAISHFDGHYDHWSMLMENFLRSKEYWPIVEDSIGVLVEGEAIERPILETILCKETSKDIWDSMKKKFQDTTRMKEGESVTSYCARTIEISNMMRFHGEKMNDVTIVENILHFLTPKYDYVVCSIEESKETDVLSLDELKSSFLVHEQKMTRSSTSEEQALKASTFISSNSRGRGRGRVRGRGRGDRGNKDGSRNFRANDDYNKGRGRDF
ncbi:hypothetical protein KY284_022268 [Solanum tuberosum]|nr:hypothetical protein KY284_022268 [Solanum tuberosum]